MAFYATIPDIFRHRVCFVPYNILPQIPAVFLQSKSQKPRYPDQVFPLVPARHSLFCVPLSVPRVCGWLRAGTCGVAVPDIDPQRPIRPQNVPHFTEYQHKAFYVLFRRFLHPDLSGRSVVPQIVVRRGSNAGIYAFRLYKPQHFQCVPMQNGFHTSSTPHIFGPRKIASMDGKGAGSFPPPNFKRPFIKRISARFMMKS